MRKNNRIQFEKEKVELDNERTTGFEIIKNVHPLNILKDEMKDGIKDQTATYFNNEKIIESRVHLHIVCASRMIVKNPDLLTLLQLIEPNKDEREIQLFWMEMLKVNESLKADPIDSLFNSIQMQYMNLFKIITNALDFLRKLSESYHATQSFVGKLYEKQIGLVNEQSEIAEQRFCKFALETVNVSSKHLTGIFKGQIPIFDNLTSVLNEANIMLDDLEINHKMLYANPNENFTRQIREQISDIENIMKHDFEKFKTIQHHHTLTPKDLEKLSISQTNEMDQLKSRQSNTDGDSTNETIQHDTHLNWYQIQPCKTARFEELLEQQIIKMSHLNLNQGLKPQETHTNLYQLGSCTQLHHGQRRSSRVRDRADKWLSSRKTTSKLNRECTICGVLFANKHSMERHWKSIHIKNFGFTCFFCEEIFSRKDYLRRHQSFFCKKGKKQKTTNTKTNLQK